MRRRVARKAKPFWTLDCETDPFKAGRVPAPFIWGAYQGDQEIYEEFATPADVASFFRNERVLVYAHNGGKFDYHYLREYINSDELIQVISGRLARFKIGDAEFRDSMNILVNPLRAFAKEEIDYAKLEPDVRHLHMDEIRRYLRSDCVNLWNTVEAYFDRYGRSLTQAGAAMKYWKKNNGFTFRPQSAPQAERCRPYYFGGRVECFATGYARAPFEVVDINSAYPYAMMRRHPMSPEAELEHHLPAAGQMGNCLIRLEAVSRGALPLRDEDGSLWFPYDESTIREYTVTGWELEIALEHDAVKIFRVRDVYRFTQTVDFVDYVQTFYAERKAAKARGDKMGDIFAKLFLNSLYGKFGSNPEKYREYVIADDESQFKWCHPKLGYECVGAWGERHLLARPLPEESHRFYNVATAASITGFVRAHLFRALMSCSGLLYCDTDSVAARDISRLPLGGNLGEWKHEMRCSEYAIAGKKLYAFRNADACPTDPKAAKDYQEWKTASKGTNLNADDIVAVARGDVVVYTPEVPTYSLHNERPEFVLRQISATKKNLATLAGRV